MKCKIQPWIIQSDCLVFIRLQTLDNCEIKSINQVWGGRWNSVQNTCFSVSDIIICVWQCQRQLNQYKCFIWSDQLKHKHHNTNVPIPYLMIRSSSEFCSDEKLSLKIRWWKTYTNLFSALMRLYFFSFKGKSLIKSLSFEILWDYQTHFFSLFWINWFWNIFVYTVVKVFTSIYLKYWKEHLNIFISSIYHQH